MIFKIYKGNKTPDKILRCTFKEREEKKKVKLKFRLPVFKDVKEKEIAGYLTGKMSKDMADFEGDVLEIKEEKDGTLHYGEVAEKKKKLHFIRGYVQVEEEKYVAVQRGFLAFLLWFLGGFLLLLLLIWLLSALIGADAEDVSSNDPLKIEEGVEWDGEAPLSGKNSEASSETIDIAGYANIFLSEKQKTINLINPDGNTVYFKYVITDKDDNVLIETDLIAPNTMVERDLFSLLEKGEHMLTFKISTYDIDTYAPCNGAITEVRTVIE